MYKRYKSRIQDVIFDSFKLQSNVEKLAELTQRALHNISILEMPNIFLDHTTILTMMLNKFEWDTQNFQSVDKLGFR